MSAFDTRSVSDFYFLGVMSDEERSVVLASSRGSTPEQASGVLGGNLQTRSKLSPGKRKLVVFHVAGSLEA